MSQHQKVFTAERTIPASEAVPGVVLPGDSLVPAPASPDRPKTFTRRRLRSLLFAAVAVAALLGAADYGWDYWTTGRFEVATDDAYVKADSTTIAPKISGYIATVLVADNEPVKAGQVLGRIDDRDFKVSREQAEADVK